jgi:3-hydroxyisobutyrate dehydrogenase-like beta-hydroxyacid dehydrogenase
MTDLPTIGFIGLGEMGGPMAVNLLRAGYPLIGYDPDAERLAAVVDAGGEAGADEAGVVRRCDVIATSLPSSGAWIEVAERDILPNVRAGQFLIDFGTVTPPETRRLAALFAAQGVAALDVPVSGGGRGAQQAQLYMFVGGECAAFERCLPILQTVGGPDRITYCGPAGNGQVVKGVNQLMMGLVDAAYLEAISFGVNSGVDVETISQAIGCQGRWRVDFHQTAQRIAAGQGANVGVKFRELPYFLSAAQEGGFDLPIAATVYGYCDKGERVVIDDHRQAPSYWHELTNRD